jgi:hypothetical protein
MNRVFPDFFIVGAPKAGTTSLYRYLGQHSRIFMSARKEPLFFCGYESNFIGPGSKAFNRDLISDEKSYLELFKESRPDMITGEASTDYLSCPLAGQRIKEWNENAKIIIILRNPIERAFSEHMHLIRDGLEKNSFKIALELEQERRKKGYIPLFWHTKRGFYYEATKIFIELFGKRNVKIVLFDEYLCNAEGVTQEVLSFLGVENERLDISSKANVSGVPNIRFLQDLYRSFRSADHNSFIKRLARILSASSVRQRVQNIYLSRNMRRAADMGQEERQYLTSVFREDVKQLGKLLEIDLRRWLGDV